MAREVGSVQSVERALDLLDNLAASSTPLSASDLSRACGLPYPTVHRLLQSLLGRGYVRRAEASKSYAPGPRLILASFHFWRLVSVLAQSHLEELAKASGETANLAVLDGSQVTYVAQAQSHNQLRMFTEVGARVPASATAVGKVLLAHQPPKQVLAQLTATDIEPRTSKTITDIDQLMTIISQVAVDGYALDDEEGELGVRCIAVPVQGGDGVNAAISISGPVARLTKDVQQRILPIMVDTASRLASTLQSNGLSLGMDVTGSIL